MEGKTCEGKNKPAGKRVKGKGFHPQRFYAHCDDGQGYDVETFGNYICVDGEKYTAGEPENGFFEIYDSSDTSVWPLPLLAPLSWSNASPRTVIQSGRYLYVADFSEGLVIVKLF